MGHQETAGLSWIIPTFAKGFTELFLGSGSFDEYIRLRVKNSIRLEGHPFGLPLYPTENEDREVVLLGDPDSPEDSTNAMATLVRGCLSKWSEQNEPFYMRIIRVPSKAEGPSERKSDFRYCFEFSCYMGVFIVGRSTAYSGEGGRTRMTLERVFDLVSHIFGTYIDTATVGYESGRRQLKTLHALHDEKEKERELVPA